MLSRLLFACASVLQDYSNLFLLKVKKIKLCEFFDVIKNFLKSEMKFQVF